jgi:hypothetical protein
VTAIEVSRTAVAWLLRLLASKDRQARYLALRGLWSVGVTPVTQGPLRAALRDKDPKVRRSAKNVLDQAASRW